MIWNLSANSTKMILIRNTCALNFRLSLCTSAGIRKVIRTYKKCQHFLCKELLPFIFSCSAITHIQCQIPYAAHATYACHKCIFRTSERSFSALRRVKTYLRATMNQDHLNYLMLLHVHKDKTDELDLKLLVNEFINSDHRSNIFAKLD